MRLWEIKIVEPHSVSTWDFRAQDLCAALDAAREHFQTRELMQRATHIEVTLGDDSFPRVYPKG